LFLSAFLPSLYSFPSVFVVFAKEKKPPQSFKLCFKINCALAEAVRTLLEPVRPAPVGRGNLMKAVTLLLLLLLVLFIRKGAIVKKKALLANNPTPSLLSPAPLSSWARRHRTYRKTAASP
jgi:hypothetical protein